MMFLAYIILQIAYDIFALTYSNSIDSVVEGRLQLLLCMMDMFFKGYFLLTCINAFDRGCLLPEHMEGELRVKVLEMRLKLKK